MAYIQRIPIKEALRASNPKINENFESLNAELVDHIHSSAAHPAQSISYQGEVANVYNVKDAIDKVDGRISEIVAQSGDDNTEVVDARGGYPVLGDRLDSIVQRINNLMVNVKDYGAKGDGVTDDSANIQAAINDVRSAGGGSVFFPAGSYRISTTLKIYKGVNMFGANTDAVRLLNQTGDACIQFLGQQENDRLFVTIDNLTITSSTKSTNIGIRIRNAGGFTLNNVNITNQKLGFWVAGSNAVTVNRCDINECTTGILVGSDSTSIGVVYVDGFTLSNSNLGGNIIHIIDTGSHSLGSRFYVGNAFYCYAPTTVGIWMGGTKGVVISGNWFEMGDGTVAIRLDYKDPDGVVINTPFGTEITGNSFGSRGDIFIDIREAAGTVIEGNTFSGAAQYCIKVRTGAGRNQIGANMYENIIGVPISVDFPEFADILDNSKDTIRGIRQKKGGVGTLIQDGSNGYFEVTMPIGGVNWNKVSISTLWKASATANYNESPTQISWKDMDSITVRIMVAGKTSGSLSYSITESY